MLQPSCLIDEMRNGLHSLYVDMKRRKYTQKEIIEQVVDFVFLY